MIKYFCFILFLLWASFVLAQKPSKDSITELKPIACDCKSAIPLNIGWNTKYGPTSDTKGYGLIQEIPVKERFSKYYFETEHNSAWYRIKINVEGELVFDIVPIDPKDDYDFLLFKYTDTGFCHNFISRKLIPVRTNISRVSSEDRGKTGLSLLAKVEYETRGKGYAYSKLLHVKKGEQYMLILDNVYDNGKGHSIFFHVLKDFHLTGITLTDDSTPINAGIAIRDKKGEVVAATTSEQTTGKYMLNAPLEIGGNYTVNYSSATTFFDIKTIVPTIKLKDTFTYKPVILPVLKEGKTYKLKNILFVGDSARIIPSSLPTLIQLTEMLKTHKNIKIRIEGHVNAPDDPVLPRYQLLSDERAQMVYNYLIENGINKDRLSWIGLANRFPIYTDFPLLGPDESPDIITQEKAQQNRRVEIRIISIGE